MKLDLYSIQARLKPALLVVLPASLAVAAWFPDEKFIWAGLAVLLTSFGLCALLAQFGRDMGKAKQEWLFEQWGGKSTTVMLRYSKTTLDWVTHARIHTTLSEAVGIPAPTKDAEAADPKMADEVYEAFATFLREATRDTEKHRLVFAENVNFGFRRNLWGMKPIGVTVAALGVVVSFVSIVFAWSTGPPALAVVATALNMLLLLAWIFWITPSWVRVAAEAYAQRLLEACGSLPQPASKALPAESSKTT